jgi:hypothetical protein
MVLPGAQTRRSGSRGKQSESLKSDAAIRSGHDHPATAGQRSGCDSDFRVSFRLWRPSPPGTTLVPDGAL